MTDHHHTKNKLCNLCINKIFKEKYYNSLTRENEMEETGQQGRKKVDIMQLMKEEEEKKTKKKKH